MKKRILALLLALTLLAYNRRVARKVVAISHEVQSIGEGNLYLQLEPKGSGELAALTLLVPGGCTVRDTVQIVESSVTTLQELADAALSEKTEAPESGEQFVTAEDPEVTQTADTVGEHGYYYDAEHVVLYLDT